MKKVNLIAQSKGGSGKSFITWLFAYTHREANSIFLDLDQSTRTSFNRLTNIIDPSRLEKKSIIDNNMKLDREKFLDLFEEISNSEPNEWFIDFGATESEELKSFLKNDYSASELIQVLDELQISLKIYVVIAGKDAFKASTSYLTDLINITQNHIPIIALKNEGTFKDLVEKDYSDAILKSANINFIKIANMPLGSSSTSILQFIGGDLNESDLKLAARLGLKKMVENFSENVL